MWRGGILINSPRLICQSATASRWSQMASICQLLCDRSRARDEHPRQGGSVCIQYRRTELLAANRLQLDVRSRTARTSDLAQVGS